MTNENQQSISIWAEETFGPAKDPVVLVDRAIIEMKELREAVQSNNTTEIGKETADVLILLYRLLSRYGLDTSDVVTLKMAENRLRKWLPKGDGTGSHIKT
jgi:NTP pyrophosphatase (non-canonical NTP hydrolase)